MYLFKIFIFHFFHFLKLMIKDITKLIRILNSSTSMTIVFLKGSLLLINISKSSTNYLSGILFKNTLELNCDILNLK